jgi:hypothetical protein
VSIFSDLFRRLGQSWRWLLVQLLLTPVLALLFLGWTRIPEKNFLEVAATLLLPLLLLISIFELEAGTMRSLATDDGRRVKLIWGAIAVAVCALLAWIGWSLLDTFDEHIWAWASYLNSQTHDHTRLFTYDHIQKWLTITAWVLRWIAVPALTLPFAATSAQWGHRLPWRKVSCFLLNWKWWCGVAVVALLGAYLPSHFFNAPLSGTVQAQKLHVALKLSGAYMLGLASWVVVLGWLAGLLDSIQETERSREAELFCQNLRAGWRLGAAAVGIIFAINLPVWPLTVSGDTDTVAKLAMGIRITAFVAVYLMLISLYRAMFPPAEKKARIYWGILASIVWFGITFGVASQDEKFPLPLLHWEWGDFVTFVFFAPFVASAAVWGWLLPWQRIVKLFRDPRWLAVGVATFVAETYLSGPIAEQFASKSPSNGSPSLVHDFLAMTLDLGFVVLQLAWLAALLAPVSSVKPPEEQPFIVAVGPDDPDRTSSIKLDLPE